MVVAQVTRGESWPWLGSFSPVQVFQGQGETLLPVAYLDGLTLDAPLSDQLTTGASLNISGTLTDTSLSKIQFYFTSTDGDDQLVFFFDVMDGRFDGHLFFSQEQAGEYELDLYVYDKEEDSWPWLDSFSPVQVLQGQGEIYLPIDFFSGIILDAPLATEHPIGRLLVLHGTVAHPIPNFDFSFESL